MAVAEQVQRISKDIIELRGRLDEIDIEDRQTMDAALDMPLAELGESLDSVSAGLDREQLFCVLNEISIALAKWSTALSPRRDVSSELVGTLAELRERLNRLRM